MAARSDASVHLAATYQIVPGVDPGTPMNCTCPFCTVGTRQIDHLPIPIFVPIPGEELFCRWAWLTKVGPHRSYELCVTVGTGFVRYSSITSASAAVFAEHHMVCPCTTEELDSYWGVLSNDGIIIPLRDLYSNLNPQTSFDVLCIGQSSLCRRYATPLSRPLSRPMSPSEDDLSYGTTP